MNNLTSITEFKKLGYIVQLPNETDRTYFMIKHFNKPSYTKQIYITTYAKSATVEIISSNPKYNHLDKKETSLVDELIFLELGLAEYKII